MFSYGKVVYSNLTFPSGYPIRNARRVIEEVTQRRAGLALMDILILTATVEEMIAVSPPLHIDRLVLSLVEH